MARNPASPSKVRFLKVYWLTFAILFRYWRLSMLSKVLGEARMESRWERTHLRTAKQIKKHILELKGLFIKVGQMISIMTHFLPRAYTEELEGLQDSVPPAPYSEIERRFLEEFDKRPDEFFERFERVPIASASLGQVHAAWNRAGQKLAVKVQYPDIEEIVRIDLKTLKRIFGLLHLIFPQYGLKKTYVEIREVVLDELDFKKEGENLERLAKNFAEEKDMLFSKVHWESSTTRVLTLEFMEGVKISNVKALRELGLDPAEVATKIIHAYCKQIFLDGIYHADPHPGNFLVQAVEEEVEVVIEPEGETPEEPPRTFREKKIVPKIIMMDFGAVARISEPMRKGIAKFFEGIIKRDNQVISQAMKEMGFIAKTQDEEVFDKIVEFFYERLKDIKIEELKNFQLNQMNRLEDLLEFRKLDISIKDLLNTFNVPKDWALLERALILLVGLTTHLAPELNPLTIIIPYAETFVLGKDRTFADLIVDAVKEVLLSYLKLPTELERTLRLLNKGEISVNSKTGSRDARLVSGALHRLSYILLGLGGLNLGYLLQKQGVSHYEWGYYGAAFFGFMIAVNFIRGK
ncbi:MAG: AarF/UbiB family protein [bacterium]